NIFVSERMSLFALFLTTFPVAAFGMYFDYKVSKAGMFLVVSGWVLTAAVKLTNSYNGLTVKMKSRSSVRKHKHSYGFVTDSKNVAQIALMWLGVIAVVTGLAFAVVPDEHFELALPTDGIRKSTERVVKNFLSYGISSVFSLESNSASPGSLSTVANVAYDGMTDLRVQLVNYRADRIYLRQFSGYAYDGDNLRWNNIAQSGADNSKKYNYTPERLMKDYEGEQRVTQSVHRMSVRIVDPALLDDPVAVPYYSALTPEENYRFENSGSAFHEDKQASRETQYFTFYTVDTPQTDYSFLTNGMTDEEKEGLIPPGEEPYKEGSLMTEAEIEASLEVPEKNLKAVSEFCENYGIKPGDSDIISKVITALEENFTYTLQPGKIPYGEDYVNYFLRANMKGYCQHFASAATLIFRYLGLPARYAEGYVINREDFYLGKDLTEENAQDWITTPYSVP
ncbi:MAG: transglutaminase domain-containing protein, partial [Clostridia bacterium]|nr:transglutaminase domain-containing protein [Clostridia bacterium]